MKRVVSIGGLDWIEEIKGLADGVILSDAFHGCQSTFAFSEEEIKQGIDQSRKASIFSAVLMNRMYMDDELEEAKRYMQQVCDWGVSWIYYQDPAIYMIASELGKENQLVYDPDTLLTNGHDLKWVMSQGVHHGVISKEITFDEMKNILKVVQGVGEIIIFGYLKLSTSRRRLIQNYCDEVGIENPMTGSKEGYLIESTRTGKMPIVEDQHGTHIFTDYILCALEESRGLKQAGLQVARIEGIFLNKEMIVDVLKVLVAMDAGERAEEAIRKFQEKYKSYPFSTGYMHQKTNLVK